MSCFDVGEGFSGQCPYVDLEIERLAVLDLCDCIAQQAPGRVGLVALDRVENQYECDQGGGTQRGGEGAQPAAASGGGSFASLVCLIGRCSQDPLFQIGRDRYTVRAGDILTDRALEEELGREKYPLVLANIVADVIIPLSAWAPKVMTPDGVFLCSGIIAPRAQEVADALARNGLKVVRRREKNGWAALEAVLA